MLLQLTLTLALALALALALTLTPNPNPGRLLRPLLRRARILRRGAAARRRPARAGAQASPHECGLAHRVVAHAGVHQQAGRPVERATDEKAYY